MEQANHTERAVDNSLVVTLDTIRCRVFHILVNAGHRGKQASCCPNESDAETEERLALCRSLTPRGNSTHFARLYDRCPDANHFSACLRHHRRIPGECIAERPFPASTGIINWLVRTNFTMLVCESCTSAACGFSDDFAIDDLNELRTRHVLNLLRYMRGIR